MSYDHLGVISRYFDFLPKPKSPTFSYQEAKAYFAYCRTDEDLSEFWRLLHFERKRYSLDEILELAEIMENRLSILTWSRTKSFGTYLKSDPWPIIIDPNAL